MVCKRRSYGEANLGVVFFCDFCCGVLALQKKTEGLGWRVWMMRTYGAATLRSVAVGAGFRPLPSQVYIYILYVYTYYPISICSHIVTSNVFNVLSGGWPGGAKLGLLGSGLAGKPSPWHP